MEQSFIQEFSNRTVLHPIGAVAMIILGTAMLTVPRRYAVLPMIIMACFIAPAQRLVIASLDFDLLRLMVLVGFVRLVVKQELRFFRWTALDGLIVMWAVSATVTYTVQWGTIDALLNRLGVSFDAVGMYFLFRCLICSWGDLEQTISGFLWLAIPVSVFFLIEHATGRNMFSIFGGVPQITDVREGRLRCQGAFAHPIIAGCFWASVMPLMAARWWHRGHQRWLALVGVMAGSLIVLTCASSTPVLSILMGIVGALLFPLRHHLRWVRWGAVGVLLFMQFVMNSPVWILIGRISVVGGSTGWHRVALIDNAIRHIDEWMWIGTRSTSHWGWGLQDITNHYIQEGVRGGALTLLIFLTVVAVAFRRVGTLCEVSLRSKYSGILAWALGVSLFVHCVNFLGVSYFGQIMMVWYLHLAAVGSLSVQQQPVQSGSIRAARRISQPAT